MVLDPEQFKKPDGAIDWKSYILTRLKNAEEKEKTRKKITKPKEDPGEYRNFIVHQQALLISDLNNEFCQNFLDPIKDRRIIEQMTRADGVGKQSIVGGDFEKV